MTHQMTFRSTNLVMPSGHIDSFDGWRGLAILFVLGCHFGDQHFLGIGVTVFFVLSGVLMARILFIRWTPLPEFYWRRASRILPGLWFYLLIAYATAYFASGTADPVDLGCTLVFLRSYCAEVPLRSEFANAHMWSLAVEEHGYLLLSVIAWLATRRFGQAPGDAVRLFLWLACCIALISFAAYKFWAPSSAGGQFFVRTEVAALPLLLSAALQMEVQKRPQLQLWSWLSPVTFILAVVFTAVVPGIGPSWLLCSLLLAVSVNSLPWSTRLWIQVLESRVLRWFGTCSFSIYLWQQLFFMYGSPVFLLELMPLNEAVWSAICSVGAGACSFYLIESPARVWLNGHMPKLWGQGKKWQPATTALP